MSATFRIGQIVPSSNTTMETEIPAMLNARAGVTGERFTFHSSRMRMKSVTSEELERMDDDSLRCAAELTDARVDVIGYACLVAIMSRGAGYHRLSEARLNAVTREEGANIPVTTSAGALIDGLKALGAGKIALIAPYMRPLTQRVIEYLGDAGIEVVDSLSFEIPDNLEVARRDPARLVDDVDRVDLTGADALVLSACVQMQSLSAIEAVQRKTGLPVTSAAACTVRSLLLALELEPVVPGAGAVLSRATAGAAGEPDAGSANLRRSG